MERASSRVSRQTWRRAGGGVCDENDLAKRRSRLSSPLSQVMVMMRGSVRRAKSHTLRRSSIPVSESAPVLLCSTHRTEGGGRGGTL
jgi:hypothetical protein